MAVFAQRKEPVDLFLLLRFLIVIPVVFRLLHSCSRVANYGPTLSVLWFVFLLDLTGEVADETTGDWEVGTTANSGVVRRIGQLLDN